jgi:hypothetical protein
MTDNFIKDKKIWVPERVFGVCIWIMPDGLPLTDGDGVLCAEGFVGDPKVEKRVADAASYWTSKKEGYVRWVQGARKVSQSEREDQQERLANGLTPDPVEDILDEYFRRK